MSLSLREAETLAASVRAESPLTPELVEVLEDLVRQIEEDGLYYP